MIVAGIALAALIVAAVGTGQVRHYALRRRLIDVPNARSSHEVPTPRGGGMAVVAAIVVTFTVGQWLLDPLFGAVFLPLIGLLVVAAIGWIDDHQGAGVTVRLCCHAFGAMTLLPLVLTPSPIPLWWPPAIAVVAWLFWGISAINVVNFMDGIDGLVGSQALIFGAHLFALGGPGTAGVFGAALAGASAGFLWWNWAPAKTFLGDVGSGALGFAMVFGGALLARDASLSLIVVFLPLYPMFLDATVTLLRRARRGERLIEAHRSHLYQVLANGDWGHAPVSALYAGAAAVGVLVAGLHATPGWPAIVASYFVLVFAIGAWLSRGRTL